MPANPKQDFSRETWRIFRIISEFVDGFEALRRVDKAVTIFGSARTEPGAEYYERPSNVHACLRKPVSP